MKKKGKGGGRREEEEEGERVCLEGKGRRIIALEERYAGGKVDKDTFLFFLLES